MAVVRRAVAGDAAELAAVHVACWEETYRGVLPAAYLAERTEAARYAFWRDRLGEAEPGEHVFVGCAADKRIVGFASCGPERTGLLGVTGELYALYVLQAAQGAGLGRRLTEAVLTELGDGVAAWVLGVNPARGFYERIGARQMTTRQSRFAGARFTEVAYLLG